MVPTRGDRRDSETDVGKSRPGEDLHVTRGAPEPYAEGAHAEAHEPNQCLLERSAELEGRICASVCVLQPVRRSLHLQGYARDGSRHHSSCLGFDGVAEGVVSDVPALPHCGS